MKKIASVSISICLALMLVASAAFGTGRSAPLVINHLCTDLNSIPSSWIDSAQTVIKWHYAHTSHGSQLTEGLNRIEIALPIYEVEMGDKYLPIFPDPLCVFNGQESGTYITPELYWRTANGMLATRNVLNHNPQINVSAFMWCTELESATAGYVQSYLDSMAKLEQEFPAVTFVYMTANAQSYVAAEVRTLRNAQIRDYCVANNKVLYDFEDLDCWWFDPDTEEWEHSTTTDSYGNVWPVQHPHFDGAEVAHTTWESCEQKGKAVWWLMVRLAGWDETTAGVEGAGAPRAAYLAQNFPNPFNPTTKISFGLMEPANVSLRIYDAAGRLVRVLAEGGRAAGAHAELWDGRDGGGNSIASGIYFYRLKAGTFSETRKMMLVK